MDFTLLPSVVTKMTVRWLKVGQTRGKTILEQLSRPHFFPGFEISCSFLCAEQVGKKGGKFQNPEKIVVLKVVLISFCL